MSSNKKYILSGIIIFILVSIGAGCGYYHYLHRENQKLDSQKIKTQLEETPGEITTQKADGIVIFLHSGGFVVEKNEYHEAFGAAIGQQLGFDYVVPDYPVNTTYKETLSYMEEIYKNAREQYDKVWFIGCSAGANLAVASMLKYGDTYGMPDKLILMSPWLDTSMGNENIECVSDFDKEFYASLVTWGENYNGGDKKTIYASPLKAKKSQLKNFPETIMFEGELDILRFDAEKFSQKLEEAGVNCTYVTAKGKNHGEVFAEFAGNMQIPEIMKPYITENEKIIQKNQ